ncbi:winged helix-turn-helix domain-containing protein [Nonomuraea bangladeshensis]|uniref:Winged helix-turn-helix domain-containing protein n=1 Tax=Nonomuraea bangladeshensis TaxID=404385 RepID=A0ABV3H461_9ACTN
MIQWRQNAPKWVQVADILKARIADGTYPPDTPLPSEHRLVQEFGPEFSRGTARKVLTRLREEGVAYSVRGLGTFVAGTEGGASDRRGEG